MSAPFIIDHIIFILFGLLLPVNSMFRAKQQLQAVEEWDTYMKVAVYRGNSLFLWFIALVVIMVWMLTGRPLAILGFQPPIPESWPIIGLITGIFIVVYAIDVGTDLIHSKAREKARKHLYKYTPFIPATSYEMRQFMLVAVTAGICEEIIFRGFFITYFLSLFGDNFQGQAIALIVPTIIFALAHYYQGWKAIGKIAVLSLAFGFIFLISRSLWIPMLLHILVDWWSGLAGKYIITEGNGTERNGEEQS